MNTLAVASMLVATASVATEGPTGAFEHSVRGKIELRFAAAFPVRASWDRDQHGIQVLLTMEAIDAQAAAESDDPYLHAANQQQALGDDHVLINVWDDGMVAVSGVYEEDNAQFIANTRFGLRSEIEPVTGDRIVGRVWTDEPMETSDGETYSLDLSFDVAIARPPAAVALPQGGGAPGEALMALVEVVLAGSWEDLKPLLTAEQIEAAENGWAETDEERIGEAVGSLQQWLVLHGQRARSVSILEASLREDGLASLDVAVEHADATMICQARMREVEERWVFERMKMLTIE
jgi:hypothetical protein